MSDLMLCGMLRMPLELHLADAAFGPPQLQQRMLEAADELEKRAARIAELARENEALRKDAERYRWLRRKICFNGNGDGTATMHAINLPNATKFPDVGEVEIGVDAAIDAALKEQSKC